MSTREELAKAYDPDAFEDHPAEKRSNLAAVQWGARRHLATEAADRLLASEWLAAHDAKVRADTLEEAAVLLESREFVRGMYRPRFEGGYRIAHAIRALAAPTERTN